VEGAEWRVQSADPNHRLRIVRREIRVGP
jgi:hypothetical protein